MPGRDWIVRLSSMFILMMFAAAHLSAQDIKRPLGTMREQAKIQMQWLEARLDRVLPTLMRRHGVEMWLVICSEYNEDPVFFSLTAPTTFAARRRTIYVFHDRGETQGVERLALGGGSQGGVYTVYRDPEIENRELWGKGQWALLRKLIEDRNPSSIAINVSNTHAFSNGLSSAEREMLQDALGEKWNNRLVRAELLPLDYIAIRVPEMMDTYRQMMQTVHNLISRAFSNEVITPGKQPRKMWSGGFVNRSMIWALGSGFIPLSVGIAKDWIAPAS